MSTWIGMRGGREGWCGVMWGIGKGRIFEMDGKRKDETRYDGVERVGGRGGFSLKIGVMMGRDRFAS